MLPFKKRLSIFKKREIWKYLNSLEGNKTVFDQLLRDCMDGTMRDILLTHSFKHLEIHLDWNEKIKRIGIKGTYRYNYTYIDIEIFPDEFTVSYGAGKPSESTTYPLVSKEQVYNSLEKLVMLIHRN
jgi:hypothetical protein